MDAKDILGLPKNALPSQEKKSKPPKESQRKPDGISRELYALTGGLAPLVPAIDANHLKRKAQSGNEKITWQWLSFTNSARKDKLQLYHWVRVINGSPPTGDYSFTKCDKLYLIVCVFDALPSVDTIKYTDEEYEKYLTDPAWTKDETDQLFDLCERFDLRFLVVADKFPTTKTVEELEDRYYSVSRALIIARAPSSDDVAGHPLFKEQYNAAQETERKRALNLLLSHTKQQKRKDVDVLAHAKRITEARKTLKAADKAADTVLPVLSDIVLLSADKAVDMLTTSTNHQHPPSSALVFETGSFMASLRTLHVYLRTYALEQMVQAECSSAGLQTIKRVEQTLQDLGVNLKPKVPTKAVWAEHLELRKEILTLLNIHKQLQYKEVEGSSFTETKPLVRAADLDRAFIPDSVSIIGDKFGKRKQKRKGPRRVSEAPSSPAQSKRPRKYKTSD